MRRVIALPLVLALLGPGPAPAQDLRVNVRVGDHPSFGRLVFDWPSEVPYRVVEESGRIVLRFTEPAQFDLERARRGLRNLRGIEATGDSVTITVAEGVRPRHFRIASRVVLDLLDANADPNAPASASQPRPPANAAAAAPATVSGAVSAPAAPTAVALPRPATVASGAMAPSAPVAPATGTAIGPAFGAPAAVAALPAAAPLQSPAASPLAAPPTLVAVAVEPPPAQPAATAPERPLVVAQAPVPQAPAFAASAPGEATRGSPASAQVAAPAQLRAPQAAETALPASSIALPFPAGTGAAVFAHRGTLVVTFDAAGELDLPSLRRWFPGAQDITVEGSRNATTLLLPLDDANRAGVRLALGTSGWRLERGAAGRTEEARDVTPEGPAAEGPRRVLLPMANPGRVVTVREPDGDGLIQVGPSAAGPLAALPGVSRSIDGATLIGTRLGVAVLVQAEDVSLRRVEGGFLLSLPRREHTVEDLSNAPPVPRLLDLQNLPVAELLARRLAALAESSAASHQARSSARLRHAETLVALGLGFEALGVLDTAIEDDPRLITSPRAMMLVGAAATLAGRDAEAVSVLSSPRLDDQPEALLWRGLAAAMASQRSGLHASEDAAAAIAAGAPILFGYPEALRLRLVPGAAEALAFGGHQPRAAGLLRDPALRNLPRAALAEALLLEAQERLEPALGAYGPLTTSRDPLVRSRALERLAELRLAARRDDAGRAANLMEAAFMAWRGDEREQRLRLRTAELQRQSDQHGAALSLLAETLALFPEAEDLIRPLLDASFPPAMQDPALSLSEALRLAEQLGPNVQPAAAVADAVSALARRLMAQELPLHAAQALRIGLSRAPDPALQARLSLELAAALLDGDRPGEARQALAQLPMSSVPPALRSQRIAVEAELMRRSGEMQAAAELMRQSQAPDPLTLSEILAARQDWTGAAQALSRHVATSLPPAPAPLEASHRDLLVRLAAFASLAGDDAMLATLRRDFTPRMRTSPQAGAFTAMTGADTPRSAGGPAALSQQQRELLAAQRLQEQLRNVR